MNPRGMKTSRRRPEDSSDDGNNEKEDEAAIVARFFSIENHVFYSPRLENILRRSTASAEFSVDESEEETQRQLALRALFDDYEGFLRFMRATACKHAERSFRTETRQLRANDEAPAHFIICNECNGIIERH